jgi:hypothetical protein
VEFKLQWSYCSPDMSSQRTDMSRKPLWNSLKGPDKSGGPDMFWNRSNRFDRYPKLIWPVGEISAHFEFGFLLPLLESR